MEADKAQEIRRMFLKAIDRASENSNKKTATEGGVKYSSKEDSDSIKEQIKSNLDKLNKMNVVATIYEKVKFTDSKSLLNWVMDRLKNTGYKISRQNYGDIVLDEKRIKNGLRYLKTDAEKIAFTAVPSVIKKGIEIGRHSNHKGRQYNTVTFAAPIEINGYRGNMAVTVREEAKNYYKVHRVLTPDGSVFEIQNTKGTVERAGGAEKNSSGLSPTDSTSINNISDNSKNVNTKKIKRSLKDDEYLKLAERPEENKEKLQQMVDEKARKAMSDSKIVNENGDLLLVYHGTSEDFTVFDKTKGRANMDIQGMFFSPWEIDARGYGEKVGKYYLNIINPASESIGYKTLNKFKGENNAGIKAREYLESLGYDGVNNGNEEFIAFNSKQIKSADPVTYDNDGNVIPLSERFNDDESDIRYSVKDIDQDQWKSEMNIYDDIYYPKSKREQSAFNRSLANKTSNLQKGEERNIIIYTADNIYFVTANGYMNGEIETVMSFNDVRAKEYEEAFRNGNITDETYAYENLSRRWNQQEGQYSADDVSGNRRGSRGTAELDKKSESNADSSANTRKNWSNAESEKAEKRSLKDVEEVDIKYSKKYNKGDNAFSKALTAEEWIKYNSAITTGVDAGLRINDHSMLVECESGDYSYKLVIYDNTFEEKPIQAVYGIGNDSYSNTTIHKVAKVIAKWEDEGYGRSFIEHGLRHYAEMHGIVLGKYSEQTSRYSKFRTGNIGSRANTQKQSNGGTVSSGTQKIGKQSLKDNTDVETSSIIDTSSTRYILSEALKGTALILKHLYSSIRCF